MAKISPEVAKVIKDYVDAEQSFISLDVYCKLGRHFEADIDNPIHEQLRSAYGTELMPNYLCKWVLLHLEGGGTANCWKYYLPKVNSTTSVLKPRTDGRLEVPKKVLGPLALLGLPLGLDLSDQKIIVRTFRHGLAEIKLTEDGRISIPYKTMKQGNLDKPSEVVAVSFPDRVELSLPDEVK